MWHKKLCLILSLFFSFTIPFLLQAKSPADEFTQILNEYTDAKKRQDPFYAATFDVEENLNQFGDYPSVAYFEREKILNENTLQLLEKLEPFPEDSPSYTVFQLLKKDLQTSLKLLSFPNELLDFHFMHNRLAVYMNDSSQELTSFPFDSVKHYKDFIQRSQGFPKYIDQQIAVLKRGIQKKIVLNCFAAKSTPLSYAGLLEPIIEKHPFYRPILFMPKSFSEKERFQLTEEFKKMIQEKILPKTQKFDTFFKEKYIPACRKAYGISHLPQAKNWYAAWIQAYTDLSLDPNKLHETGLREISRIQIELEKIQKKLNFKGKLLEFIFSMKKNPQFTFHSTAELLGAFEEQKEKIQSKIPQYFNQVPQGDYKIVQSSNPADPAGQYQAATDLIPYGRFILNPFQLQSVPVFSVTTLLMHEAVPGHHFQLQLAFERKKDLSEYQRKIFSSNSFAEGWGLYAESLGQEMGLFADPIQAFGNLNFEMLRAVRLVVDTGIHAQGWTHSQVVKFMSKHLAMDPQGIEIEANRYSVLPGQALSYKVGQLKISELRKKAERQLGKRFDIREFHRIVLEQGMVSLPILESRIQMWIQTVLDNKKT